MKSVEDIRNAILTLEKDRSLRQISLLSGMNYITLRNIKVGTTKKVSRKVIAQFSTWFSSFDPATALPILQKPGRKPGGKTSPAAGKPTPKVKGKATAEKAAPVAAPVPPLPLPTPAPKPVAKVTKKKRGRPARVAPAPTLPTPKAVSPAAPTPPTFDATLLLGSELKKAIRETEARLVFLRSLEKAESEYRKMLGN